MTLHLTTGGGGSTTATTTTSTTSSGSSTVSPSVNLIITTTSYGSGTAVTVPSDTSGVALKISLSDFANPTSYNIQLPLDDTIIASGSWSTSGSTMTIPITGLAEGTFQMLAQVSSNTMSLNSNMVTLSVAPIVTTTITTSTSTTTTSTSSPTANLIITTVSNGSGTAITVTTDTSGVALQISLSDFPNPTSYNIQLPFDDTIIAKGSWSTTSSILTVPITGLAEGTFEMLAQVSSSTVSVNSNMVVLSVAPSVTTTITTTTSTTTTSTVSPSANLIITTVSNGSGTAVTVTTDTSGVALQISLSDFPNPISYSISSASSEGLSIIKSGSWSTSGSTMTIPITGLVQGTFDMFAKVLSTTSSITSNTVTLSVVPNATTSSPIVNLIITTVSNGSGTAVTVTTDTSGVALQISLSDFPNPTSYYIELPLDDTTIASGSWSTTSSILTVPITGLARGTFQMIAGVSSNTMSLNSNMVTLSVAPNVTTTITTTTGTLSPVLEKIAIGAGIASVIGIGIATYFLTRKK